MEKSLIQYIFFKKYLYLAYNYKFFSCKFPTCKIFLLKFEIFHKFVIINASSLISTGNFYLWCFDTNEIINMHYPCKWCNIMRKRDTSLSMYIKFPLIMRTSDDDMSCVKFTLYPQHLLSPINATLITNASNKLLPKP